MGFSYSAYGLCCDFCDHDKSTRKYVKKIDCPYGYCQAWACCDVCRAKKLHKQCSCNPEKKTHMEFCKVAMIEFEVKKLNEKGIICKMSAVLCSNCKAHVIRIESGSKFSSACIYEKCKYSKNFEELRKLHDKVVEIAQ